MAKRIHDITGMRSGKLTVIKRLEIATASGNGAAKWLWLCRCDCGQDIELRGWFITTCKRKSCGCSVTKGNPTHQKSGLPEYSVWCGMINRCENQNEVDWKSYGGRGIKVSPRWRHSFENFLADMGTRPTPAYSIDRIDVNKDYEPGNCRWATSKDQNNNRRNNVKWEFNGVVKTISEWADAMRMDQDSLSQRVRVYGWTIEKALTTPPRKDKRTKRKAIPIEVSHRI